MLWNAVYLLLALLWAAGQTVSNERIPQTQDRTNVGSDGEPKEKERMVSSSSVPIGESGWTGGNGGTMMISSGSTGSTGGVYQYCGNNKCQMCMNERCYDRSYPEIRMKHACPPTACEYGCIEMVMVENDNCPLCRCDGFSTREPCLNQNDCLSPNGQCVNEICRYPAITGPYTKACDFSYQCPSDKECEDSRCVPSGDNRVHVENVTCVFPYQCPEGYSDCNGMTCWKDEDGKPSGQEGGHITGQSCVFDYECPNKYSCSQMTCFYTDKEHGNWCTFAYDCKSEEDCRDGLCVPSGGIDRHAEGVSCVFPYECPARFSDCHDMTCWQDPDGYQPTHIPGQSCVFNNQCPSGYSCMKMSCFYTGRGK